MRNILAALGVLVVAVVILGSIWLFVGKAAVLFAVLGLVVIGFLFAAYLGLTAIPAVARTFLGLALVVGIIAIGLIWFVGSGVKALASVDWSGSTTSSATTTVGQTFEVGPKDWVEKPIQPDSLWNTTTDAPVWIWAHNCAPESGKCMYMLLPDGSIFKGDPNGNMKPAPSCRPGGPPCMDFGTATKVLFKARDKDTLVKVTLGSPVRR